MSFNAGTLDRISGDKKLSGKLHGKQPVRNCLDVIVSNVQSQSWFLFGAEEELRVFEVFQ